MSWGRRAWYRRSSVRYAQGEAPDLSEALGLWRREQNSSMLVCWWTKSSSFYARANGIGRGCVVVVAEDEEQGAGRIRGAVADRDDTSDGSEGSAESG